MSINEPLRVFEKQVDEQCPELGRMLVLNQGTFVGNIYHEQYTDLKLVKLYPRDKFITSVNLSKEIKQGYFTEDSEKRVLLYHESRFNSDGTLSSICKRYDIELDLVYLRDGYHSFEFLDYAHLYEHGIALAFAIKTKDSEVKTISILRVRSDNLKKENNILRLDLPSHALNIKNFSLDTSNKGKNLIVKFNDLTDTGALLKNEYRTSIDPI